MLTGGWCDHHARLSVLPLYCNSFPPPLGTGTEGARERLEGQKSFLFCWNACSVAYRDTLCYSVEHFLNLTLRLKSRIFFHAPFLLTHTPLLLSSTYNGYTADLSCFLMTAENQWLHLQLITDLKNSCHEVFPIAEYAYTTIPTYPSGQIGFMVCCKDPNRDVSKPLRTVSDDEERKMYRYYNKRIHEASFILPTFAATALN